MDEFETALGFGLHIPSYMARRATSRSRELPDRKCCFSIKAMKIELELLEAMMFRLISLLYATGMSTNP